MRKNILFAITGFLFTLTAVNQLFAQNEKLANTMLWSVVSQRVPADTSYLFGTIHVISKEDFVMREKIWVAMQKCSILVTEIDLTNPDNAKVMEKGMKMKDGMTLKKLYKNKDYDVINSFLLEGSGTGLEKYKDIQPFFVANAVLDFYIQGTPASYEMSLTQMATTNKMQIRGLEPISAQLAIIDSIPYKEQANELLKMVTDQKATRTNYDAMVSAYKAEDLNMLDSLIDEGMPSERTRKLVLYNRNEMWVTYIINNLADNRNFIAVGAGHLGGKNGMIEKLRTAGYNVEPVFDNSEAE